MPSLVANIQDKQNIAKWKKAYSIISQAYAQTVNEGYEPCTKEHYGCPETSVLKANKVTVYFWYDKAEAITEEFKTHFISKFNGAIICNNSNNCKTNSYIHPSKIRPKTLAGNIFPSYNWSGTRFKLPTGELIMFGGTHGGPWLSVDVNGPENGPNIIGRDMFVMKLYDTSVKPMGAEGTFNPKTNGNECLCGKEYGNSGTVYFGGASGAGEAAPGACCSAVYLSK